MAQTPTFEMFKSVLHAGYAVGYTVGWSDGQAKTAVGETVGETVEAVAHPVTNVNSLVSAHGVFQNDPTWDSFMQNIENYRRYVNSLEADFEE